MGSKNPRIIFVHGLGGKPPKGSYLREWIASTQIGADIPATAFRMAYWADLRGEHAPGAGASTVVKNMPRMQKDLLVQIESKQTQYLSWWDKLLAFFKSKLISIADPLIRQFLERFIDDVWLYFYKEGAREEISERLRAELRKAKAEGRRVAVVSHSMGTIISLDVLSKWGYPVDTLITMGSPLGLEWIQHKLGDPGFPRCVDTWLNVFDDSDPVTFPDQAIEDDFTTGGSAPIDHVVADNYSQKGVRDPHHWNGYLGSWQVSLVLKSFWEKTDG